MRVLIVNRGMFMYGGAELLIVRLANYLTSRGIRNALLTTAIVPEMERDLMGTRMIIQQKFRIPLLGEAAALCRGIRAHSDEFDVVNVHNYPAELSVFGLGQPVVWMCNEPELALSLNMGLATFPRLLNRQLLRIDKFIVKRYVNSVVVADEFNARRFEKLYRIKPKIINYGIDYDFFSQGNRTLMSKTLGLDDSFVVLQVGTLTPFKNQIESIKTVEKLKDKIPHIRLVLAGWGEEKYLDMLTGYIKERGLDRIVTFCGHIDRGGVRSLYHACDVLLHPIRPQGGWLSPFEALCAESVVVVSPHMTASSIIAREGIGTVTQDYASAILDVYYNRSSYADRAKKGKEWVRTHLGWDRFCQRMTDLFIDTVGGKRQ